MRWLWVMAVALLLPGCAQEPSGPEAASESDGSVGQDEAASPVSNTTTTTSSSPMANSTGNQTTFVPGNSTGNQTGNQTENATAPPIVIVYQNTFSGSVPVDGLQPVHPFPVPAGAVRVEVTYISQHIGLFTALATVSDPGGQRISSSDACGFGTSGQATDTCLMVVDDDVGAGEWSVGLTWQVGQVTEDYTFNVTVFGVATA